MAWQWCALCSIRYEYHIIWDPLCSRSFPVAFTIVICQQLIPLLLPLSPDLDDLEL